MSIQSFPAPLVDTSIRVIRIPVEGALRLGGAAAKPARPALNGLETAIRTIAGLMLRDDTLGRGTEGGFRDAKARNGLPRSSEAENFDRANQRRGARKANPVEASLLTEAADARSPSRKDALAEDSSVGSLEGLVNRDRALEMEERSMDATRAGRTVQSDRE